MTTHRPSLPDLVTRRRNSAAGHPDEALTEFAAIRPLLAEAFGAESTTFATSTNNSIGWRLSGSMALILVMINGDSSHMRNP
jgi:hypothetical protein